MLELDKIHCGDNCDLMAMMPRESVDLVVTSPPYDDLRTYGGHSWDFFGVAWHLKRLLKPGGVIVWVVADATKDGSETGSSMEQALHFKRLGLNLHDTMIWENSNPAPQAQHPRYQPCWEFMYVLCKGYPPKTWNPLKEAAVAAGEDRGGTRGQRNKDDTYRHDKKKRWATQDSRLRRNIWRMTNGRSLGHPAPFPIALARDHIATWSNHGDVVLDPFAGSGTTAIAAKELGRRFIGLELSADYCEIAEQRLAQHVLALDQSAA